MTEDSSWLFPLIALVAFLYGSVGHGGASGYLAVMALAGWPIASMRAVALSLNILVAGAGTSQFKKRGFLKGNLLWPFVITSVPAAAVMAGFPLEDQVTRRVLAGVLIWSAYRLILGRGQARRKRLVAPKLPSALAWGLIMGALSGMVGVGGGIFLSPLLLTMGWATAKETAATTAAFILLNSAAGLVGIARAGIWPEFPMESWILFALSAWAGGWLGSKTGAGRWSGGMIRNVLGFVLVIAAVKFLL
ncbi:sulfite exporter TauE/SafE family protein [bacterium]|nr:sulfite exporter TauE/SafE family protein [bacterium]